MPYVETPDGRLILFAHVPKTGGSSVEDHLAARFGPPALLDRHWTRAWAAGGWRSDPLGVSPQHVAADVLAELLPRRPDLSFAVVRDPAARIASEYRFQSRARLPAWRRRLTLLGFPAWLRLVLAAARRDPRAFDNHIRPQADLVPEESEVFRLEDGLDRVARWLDAADPASAPGPAIGHELKSSAPPLRPGRAELRLIAEFYAADYARFGYPLPDIAAAPARCEGDLPRLGRRRDPLWRAAGRLAGPAAPALGPLVAAMHGRGRV